MKVRLFAFLAILVLIAGLVPVAAAQDNAQAAKQQLNCLGLSSDDCTIVQTAMDNFSKFTSFTPSFSLTEEVKGADAIAPQMALDSSADIKGDGTVVIDKSKATADAPWNAAALSFNITGSTTQKGTSKDVNVSFVLVDGVAYWKDSDGTWKGVALADLAKHAKDMSFSMMGMPVNMAQMQGMIPMGSMANMMPGMMGEATAEATAAAGAEATPEATSSAMHDQLMQLLQLPGFVSQTREADATLLNQNMHVFTYTADLSVLLKSPQFQQAVSGMMTQAMSQQGAGSQSNGMGTQMAMMIPAMLESTTGTVKVTRWIGADDQFVHQVTLDAEATLDLFGGTATTSSKATPIPPITVKFVVTVTLDKINSTTAATAPAGATMVSADELMSSMEATAEAPTQAEATPEATAGS